MLRESGVQTSRAGDGLRARRPASRSDRGTLSRPPCATAAWSARARGAATSHCSHWQPSSCARGAAPGLLPMIVSQTPRRGSLRSGDALVTGHVTVSCRAADPGAAHDGMACGLPQRLWERGQVDGRLQGRGGDPGGQGRTDLGAVPLWAGRGRLDGSSVVSARARQRGGRPHQRPPGSAGPSAARRRCVDPLGPPVVVPVGTDQVRLGGQHGSPHGHRPPAGPDAGPRLAPWPVVAPLPAGRGR